ncbi:MAG TPA: DUF1353 domain-containing protein [Marmoricola sp.]
MQPEPDRFYDGGVDAGRGRTGEPPDPGTPPRVVLRRLEEGVDLFAMERRIAYRDRDFGELIVPTDTDTFETDLTSVPWLFTWLVPKIGAYLPAALLHDGLVFAPGTPATYVSTDGHTVLRADANRVLRAAMLDTGTGLIRRWLVWSAVTAATMLSGAGTGWSRAEVWRRRGAVALTVVAVVVLGTLATLDLFDIGINLPWMGDASFGSEIVGGLAGAVVIPLVLALAWGRFVVAGAITGVALAVLLHVTALLLLLTGLYQALEWLARASVRLLALLGIVVVVAAIAVLVLR